MSGVISGGWGFVTAAYAVTLIAFVAYTISLYIRLSAARRDDTDE